jgi:hypothetical protein
VARNASFEIYRFFADLEGFWVNALPAALFAAFVLFDDPSVLPAFAPALVPVTPLDLVCDSALPDALFAAEVPFLPPSVFPAFDAAFLPVCSFAT